MQFRWVWSITGDISSRDVVTQGIPWNLTDKKVKIIQETKFGYVQNHSRPFTGLAVPLRVNKALTIKNIPWALPVDSCESNMENAHFSA